MMKKSILISVILNLVIFSSFAQLDLKPAIGINAARFNSNPDSLLTKSQPGYQVGASLSIGRRLFVEPGIFYGKFSQEITPVDSLKPSFTYGLNYLRIPVNLGFHFFGSNTSFVAVRVFVGPSMIIPLTIKDNSYGITKEDVNRPQFDFSVGAGLNVWNLFLDVSYGWGMTSQFKSDPIEAKMQSLFANVGFRFKLKNEEL